MSFKEMRSLTEILRCLGFNRLISIENFKTPSFELLSEILLWLASRLDTSVSLPRDVSTVQDRVIFIKAITEFMATKCHIKVNPRKVYEANNSAVKEILKIATLLYNAMNNNFDAITKKTNSLKSGKNVKRDSNSEMSMSLLMDLSNKSEELKEARILATELTKKGAELHQTLLSEIENKNHRSRAVGKQLEFQDIEKTITKCQKDIENEIRRLVSEMENVASDEANLEVKIEKKRAEYERVEKRYESLKGVRPAYMDDFEENEEVLKSLFEKYMRKHKNLVFLEKLYSKYQKIEKNYLDSFDLEIKKSMAKKAHSQLMLDEEEDDLEDDADDDDFILNDEDDDDVMDFNGNMDGFEERPYRKKSIKLKNRFQKDDNNDDDEALQFDDQSLEDDEDLCFIEKNNVKSNIGNNYLRNKPMSAKGARTVPKNLGPEFSLNNDGSRDIKRNTSGTKNADVDVNFEDDDDDFNDF